MQQIKEIKTSKTLIRYSDGVAAKIDAELTAQPPSIWGTVDGSTVLGLTISRDGTLASTSVIVPSGIAELDHEGIETAERLQHFDPLPDSLYPEYPSITIKIPIASAIPQKSIRSEPTKPRVLTNENSSPIPAEDRGYFTTIWKTIGHSVQYPSGAQTAGIEGVTVVRCKIETVDGSIHNLAIIKSSGHAILDVEAVAAFARTGGFPPLPVPLPELEAIIMDIPIEFTLSH